MFCVLMLQRLMTPMSAHSNTHFQAPVNKLNRLARPDSHLWDQGSAHRRGRHRLRYQVDILLGHTSP